MDKKSGVSEQSASLPGGGGGIRSIGDSFQPNLAMGGGSYKVPLELPLGPGGLSPKLELVYNTGLGNGLFGMGWSLAVPFIERARKSAFAPPDKPEYTVSGAERLVAAGGGDYVPFAGQKLQRFHFDGTQWTSTAPNLLTMRFGSSVESRVWAEVDGEVRVNRWLLDRVTFPGGRNIDYEYESDGTQRHLKRIGWSVFRLEFEYEDRPDPFSAFDTGYELRTGLRCSGIALHQDRLAPETLTRTYAFEYQQAAKVRTSLLRRIRVSGFRFEDGALQEAALPPLTFDYTGFDPGSKSIEKFVPANVPPPPLDEDSTLLDYRGTSLPGVMRMNGGEATYWENRGNLRWGPPRALRSVPQGIQLRDSNVMFADLDGNGATDLIISEPGGAGFYANDPGTGFGRKRRAMLSPSFDLAAEATWLVDLNGDGVADLLTVRNGALMVFFNEGGDSWRGPITLPAGPLPRLDQVGARLRLADMNGDGNVDLVLLRSRQVTYWPSLGYGRWGTARVMESTPDFDVPRPDEDVYLADLDGDGTSDLVLVGNGVIQIFLNRGGESFSEPIVLHRTPRLGVERFLLADMKGSGTPGFLWTMEGPSARPHEYWYLDALNGLKPYLLRSIDNGQGLTTTIEYTTSSFERAADLAAGVEWSGYLPFPVHVVKRMLQRDFITGQESVTEYRYHDGHYDGRAREYLGFAQVDSLRRPNANEARVFQKFYFHNRTTTARDPAFIAGKGQPHRTELIDEAGQVRQRDESEWSARPLPTEDGQHPAYLAVETRRISRRMQAGEVYESESALFEYDAIGNIVRESRRGEWVDHTGAPRADELVIENSYCSHPTLGLTNIPSRAKKTDGAGRLLKHISMFYDGPAFAGLPFGQVENGFQTRQTEIALTEREIMEAYGGPAPALVSGLYRADSDPEYGPVFVKDTRRYRVDAFGNQIETLDAIGHRITMQYDAESISPISMQQDGGAVRAMIFDPVAQQLTRAEDLNGNVLETKYDGLGNIVAVYKRGAQPGKPTETYEYRRDVTPNLTIQRVRINPDDAEPGWVKYDHRDGSNRVVQEKVLTAGGKWAAGKQELLSLQGRVLGERDAYYSATPDYDAAPPAGTAERRVFYDFAGRVRQEQLFSGGTAYYVHDKNSARFYGPERSARFDADPGTPPTRVSRTNAAGKVTAIEEQDAAGTYVERREYDPLGRLKRIVDPLGSIALESVFDLWGNRIRVNSAESGTSTYIFDAENNEVLRTDADGRSVYTPRDLRGRITEVRSGGPAGVVEETYAYDAGTGANVAGRLAKVSGKFGEAAYSYSAEGDPVRIVRSISGNPASFQVLFGYNNQRRITFVQYPDDARIECQYDSTGMLSAIPGYVDSIEYGPTGKRERILFANGIETKKSYRAGDYLLTELLTQPVGGATVYQHLKYELDPVGQVVRIEDLSTAPGKIRNNQTFEYDERNRLTRATGRGANGDYDFGYRYDELGNLVFSGESFAEDVDYGRQLGGGVPPNRLVKRASAAAPEYSYDASGNLTHDPELGDLTYDARHRLIRVDKPDGAIVEIQYDHHDRRVKTQVSSGGVTRTRYEVESVYIVDGGGATRIVFDEDRRLAIVPQAGDALLHHLDRLGNVNAVTNLATGAFVGHDEYTPYGRLSVSMVIMPHFTFQSAQFSDGLDLVLLGARHYRPALGRFITPDAYLAVNQEKIPAIIAASNLYLYAVANPANFSDPTGQLVFLFILLIAAVVGAVLGVIGAAVNGAKTWDEWLLWIVGGAIGGVLTVLTGGALGVLFGGAAAAVTGATIALTIWAAASLLGSIFTPLLDNSDSGVAWFFSFLLKWIQSPITTTIGLIAAAVVAIGGGKVDFRRGMLFVEVGPGGGALTLGAVAWTQSGRFDSSGRVPDNLARHEAFHSRTVATVGELGFYFTYVTVGAIWAAAQGGPWNSLNSAGCGNPLEKTAHTFTGDPAVAVSASSC